MVRGEFRTARTKTHVAGHARMRQGLVSSTDCGTVFAICTRMLRPALVTIAAAVVLTSSCQKSLPTGPSELARGIVVYEHANFEGGSAHLVDSVADLKDFKGPCVRLETIGGVLGTPVSTKVHHEWNDCVSSIRVAPGWRARIYRDDDYAGQSFETDVDVPNLQLVPGTCDREGLNDCITSIRVFPPA